MPSQLWTPPDLPKKHANDAEPEPSPTQSFPTTPQRTYTPHRDGLWSPRVDLYATPLSSGPPSVLPSPSITCPGSRAGLLPLQTLQARTGTRPYSDPFATPLTSRAPSIPSSPAITRSGSQTDVHRSSGHTNTRPPSTRTVDSDTSIPSTISPCFVLEEASKKLAVVTSKEISTPSLESVAAPPAPIFSNAQTENLDTPPPPPPPTAAGVTPKSEEWTRRPHFWRSFAAICVPLLLSALEGSITNTALPTISDALNLGTMFSWVATAFLLASTIFQPLYGQLADICGRKYPMMFAVFIFGVGSAICGWAMNPAMMIAGRIIQGLGTGGIDLFAEVILSDLVPLRQRGTYMSIKHGVFAFGTTMGPLLGGVFAEHGWRWCFWINLPVCAISLVLLYFWLKVGGSVTDNDVKLTDEIRKVDIVGTGLLTSSIVLILVALCMGGTEYEWSHQAVVTPMVIGAIGLVSFPFWERSTHCLHPIMPPRIFINKQAFALTVLHGFITYGMQFYLPLFFQAVKLTSPTASGVNVLPTTLTVVAMAAIGGPILSRWGKYRPIHQIGFASMTLGLGLFTRMDVNTPKYEWALLQLLAACGCGIVVSTMLPAILVELPDSANGPAAGAWAFLRGAGSLFGVAIPGAIFNLQFHTLLPEIDDAEARALLDHGQAYQKGSANFVEHFAPGVQDQIRNVFQRSLQSVWITFAVLAGIGVVLTLFERQVKMRTELDTLFGLKDKDVEKEAMEKEGTGNQ